MAKRAKGWTCQRTIKGVKCGAHNPPRIRKCIKCEKPRPVRKKPAHMVALTDYDYAYYLALMGGVEHCAICDRKPTANRKLDRDHDHKTGKPRGLLCVRCNRSLPDHMTADWLRAAADYLERTA
jgi:ribosomal protein L40E